MQFPEAERESLAQAGLHRATRAHIKQLKAEMAEAQRTLDHGAGKDV